MKKWLYNKILAPIKGQLTQGYTVKAVSQSIAVGFSMALVPILGTSTILCAAAGAVFRLNHVVLQSVNYLAYPVQIALIIPYLDFGQRLFSSQPIPLNLATMLEEFATSPFVFFQTYGWIALYGFLLWAASLLVWIPLIYLVSYNLIRVFWKPKT